MKTQKHNLNSIRKDIQTSQLILIIFFTVLLCIGGSIISVKSSNKAFDQNLKNTSELVTKIYSFIKNNKKEDVINYFDNLKNTLYDIDVISIVNKNNKRIYHTNHTLIDTIYDGTIPDFSKDKKDYYTENDVGPSGPQKRAYCIIKDENQNYEGFVITVRLKKSIKITTQHIITLFVIVSIVVIIIEIIIAKSISNRIKEKLLGYEPDTFSSMFKIRENILSSIYDGIIAIDKDKNVMFANEAARKMLSCEKEEQKVRLIKEKVFTDKILSDVIKKGIGQKGISEETSFNKGLLIDTMPIMEEDKVNGAVAIIHDRTEYTKLMEELAGTKYLVDSMRANNHDFTNKLHVILGLIQIEQYEKAISFIENISFIQRESLSKIMNSIDNSSFAALLIGKIARASECNVNFVLKDGSNYKSSDIDIPSSALITIAGNLIDNALDSMNMQDISLSEGGKIKKLIFSVNTTPKNFIMSVKDFGSGIKKEHINKIFENGFSTKGKNRGVGLYQTKRIIEDLGGTISVDSSSKGSLFIVTIKR